MIRYKYILAVLLSLCVLLSGCSVLFETDISADASNLFTVSDTSFETDNSDESRLNIWFIDVGQGDSIYIELPSSENMLIDGGSGSSVSHLLNFLSDKNVSKINYLVVTHPHEDHIGGLDDVMELISVDSVFMPNVTTNTLAFERLLDAIDDQGLKIKVPKAGSYLLGNATSDLNVQCLAPTGSSDNSLNNCSIVLRICFGSFSVILTGDAEEKSEAEMIEKGYLLKSTVLKLGHHGSSSSSSAAFLDAVCPEAAVISVGADNTYGHPSPITLMACVSRGIALYRTDEIGTILVSSNGISYSIGSETRP